MQILSRSNCSQFKILESSSRQIALKSHLLYWFNLLNCNPRATKMVWNCCVKGALSVKGRRPPIFWEGKSSRNLCLTSWLRRLSRFKLSKPLSMSFLTKAGPSSEEQPFTINLCLLQLGLRIYRNWNCRRVHPSNNDKTDNFEHGWSMYKDEKRSRDACKTTNHC